MDLSGMVDASFANDPLTKRSYFGYCLKFGANPIAWRSKLQTSVALSTRDSELMAAVHAVQHILGVRFFLKELDILRLGASSVLTDNKASMEGVQNDRNHKGSHYMGYRLFGCGSKWLICWCGSSSWIQRVMSQTYSPRCFQRRILSV